MASYSKFERDDKKNIDSKNDFKRPKQLVLSKNILAEKRERLIDYITLYRRNVHIFVEHYFQIKLHPFQRLMVYMMGKNDTFVAICSRAVGKSWLVGVFASAKAVLYPNSEIVIVSSTKEQAGVIIEKIVNLRDNYPNLSREISNITTNMNKWQVDFHNSSTIKVVAARDSARGKRSTFTIYEEFRLIDKSILDAVIRPFSYIRQAAYLKNPLYEHLIEEPKEIFISSSYHKGLWWFDEVKRVIRDSVAGKNVGFVALDFWVAVKHKIKTLKSIKSEMSKMDEIVALEEYSNVAFGENSSSYFKLNTFNRARQVEKAFYPQRPEYYNAKKNPYDIQKLPGEIRLISCDIAMRSGRQNDLSITSCIRLIPHKKWFHRELCYMEGFSGENSISQSLRIKQVYHDFNADVIVLDVQNAGITIYDQLGVITKDNDRGIEYPAYTIINHPSIADDKYQELFNRTQSLNALPVIYPISADGKLNSAIATQMKNSLQTKMWGFLVDEAKGEDYILKNYKEILDMDDIGAKSFFLAPYVFTSLTINESISLTYTNSVGYTKLIEPPNGRKDKYTSVSYGNYYAFLLDQEFFKETDEEDDWTQILNSTFVF